MSEPSTPLAHFDADARAAALTVPTVRLGGLIYRGRILSATEWLPWYERYIALGKKDKTAAAVVREKLAFYRAYITAVFPRRQLKFWAPDLARLLERQPGNMLIEAFHDFFFLQLSVITGPEESASEPSLPAEPGSGSSGPTAPASGDEPPSTPSA